MKKVLLTRSRHDVGNQYLYAYSQSLLKTAETQGWQTSKVEDEKNNPTEVQSRLSKVKFNLVIFNGHGNEDMICGYHDEPIVTLESISLLWGTITFARSCSTIGKQAVDKGCEAFVGYSGYFRIPWINEYQATPLKDPSAKPVLEVSNLIAEMLLNGATVESAVKAARKRASELMLQMLTTDEPYNNPAFKGLLDNNITLYAEGNSQASVK